MRQNLASALLFTVPLFYLHMGQMYAWPLPDLLIGAPNAMTSALLQLLLCIPVLFAGRNYFQHGLRNLANGAPNMDSLIAIGSGAAFAYGLYALFGMSHALGHQQPELLASYADALYFESAAMIITLITMGKFLEARPKAIPPMPSASCSIFPPRPPS